MAYLGPCTSGFLWFCWGLRSFNSPHHGIEGLASILKKEKAESSVYVLSSDRKAFAGPDCSVVDREFNASGSIMCIKVSLNCNKTGW